MFSSKICGMHGIVRFFCQKRRNTSVSFLFAFVEFYSMHFRNVYTLYVYNVCNENVYIDLLLISFITAPLALGPPYDRRSSNAISLSCAD